MHYILLLISAFMMGCLAAIPAGPVQIEVVRRSINGHLKTSLMVVLGAFIIDFIYGLIAFFGIAPFLEDEKIMAIFWLTGGLILSILGVLIIRHALKDDEIKFSPKHLRKKRWAFLGGLSLSATNPMMILWWLSGSRIFTDVGLIKELTSDIALSFIIAGCLGLAFYLSALSVFIYWAKKFISSGMLRRINLSFGMLLIAIATYFVYSSFSYFLRH